MTRRQLLALEAAGIVAPAVSASRRRGYLPVDFDRIRIALDLAALGFPPRVSHEIFKETVAALDPNETTSLLYRATARAAAMHRTTGALLRKALVRIDEVAPDLTPAGTYLRAVVRATLKGDRL